MHPPWNITLPSVNYEKWSTGNFPPMPHAHLLPAKPVPLLLTSNSTLQQDHLPRRQRLHRREGDDRRIVEALEADRHRGSAFHGGDRLRHLLEVSLAAVELFGL